MVSIGKAVMGQTARGGSAFNNERSVDARVAGEVEFWEEVKCRQSEDVVAKSSVYDVLNI